MRNRKSKYKKQQRNFLQTLKQFTEFKSTERSNTHKLCFFILTIYFHDYEKLVLNGNFFVFGYKTNSFSKQTEFLPLKAAIGYML